MGTEFCKIMPSALTEEALQNKPKKAVGKVSRAPATTKRVQDGDTKKEKRK
jgi:hypothetical protein